MPTLSLSLSLSIEQKEIEEDERSKKKNLVLVWTINKKNKMSSYENVVGGKLKLKGKALDVKAGGIKKKKKKHRRSHDDTSNITDDTHPLSDENLEVPLEPNEEDIEDANKETEEGKAVHIDDQLTPAERRYIEQREQIDVKRLAKKANKSHRDRIQDFNQYLANMSEHYDIPKVGPG